MRRGVLVVLLLMGAVARAHAVGGEPVGDPRLDPAPCVAAAAANDDDKIVAACGALIDNDKTARADRIAALLARARVFDRRNDIDHAIGDLDTVLRLDPQLADSFNARGELWRRKGDRPKALQDFAAALKLDPGHAAARANFRSLALELERLGALMAIINKPSFNCATARRPVEKAICATPELANLDREIAAANARVVERAAATDARTARALRREQDEYLARRNAAFGRPGFDLLKTMRERLDRLLAVERQ
jgi:tetratricopeptide (TPR) repeat protein